MAATQRDSIWWSWRAVGLHVTAVITVPGFLALGWWQLHRALGGNGLSWAYTFEWPFFALYAVYLWWRLVHEPQPAPDQAAAGVETTAADVEPEESPRRSEDAALAAYNVHLASLRAADEAKRLERAPKGLRASRRGGP